MHEATISFKARAKEALAGKGAGDGHEIAASGLGVGIVQRVGRQGDQDHALPPFRQIGPLQVAFAFRRAALAQGQKPGQARPGCDVGGQGQPFHSAVRQNQPRACDKFRQGRV